MSRHGLPLPGDPKRQAVDAWRGYEHQLWHSVLAWLDLTDEGALFLEGAEDIDVSEPSGATAVQIKSTVRSITLRSKAVREALCSYWRIRGKSQARVIRFGLITRSVPGIERGSPFGPKVAGVELWQRCKREPALAERLQHYLESLPHLPDDLREFIRTNPPDAVREQLILRITIELAGGDAAQIEHAVEVKLMLHGEKFGVSPSESKAVKNRLLKEALETVSRKPLRELDRARFLEIFEDETTVRLPNSRFVRLLETLGEKLLGGPVWEGLVSVGGPLSFVPGYPALLTVPPVPQATILRPQLIGGVARHLQGSGAILIHGSMGTGKSTIAKLVARQLNGHWRWLHLAQWKGRDVVHALLQVGLEMERVRETVNVVLDDLDLTPAQFRSYEDFLSGLLVNVRERNGSIIVTSMRSPTTRQQASLGIGLADLLAAPAFAPSEVSEFALALGCPDDSRIDTWTRLILLQTKGHPHLVHCRLAHLASKGWPVVDSESIFQVPEDIEAARSESRRLLAEQWPREQREMAYRLSVITGAFRREWALALAQESPPIDHPGDVLDSLVGPWLEPMGSSLYRVSPLIENSAGSVWPPERVRALHVAVSKAILQTSPIPVRDIITAFFHAWAGRSGELLSYIAFGIISAPRVARDSIARGLSWLIYVPASQRGFQWDPVANLSLRVLQLRVAAVVDPKIAPQIVAAWDAEKLPADVPRKLHLALRHLFAVEVIIHFQVAIPPARLLRLLRELDEVQREVPEFAEIRPNRVPAGWGLGAQGEFDIVTALFAFVVARCKTATYLNELLDGLSVAPSRLRTRMLATIQDHEESATLLVDPVWLSESKRNRPRFARSVRAFRKAIKLGREWRSPALIAAASRGLAIIFAEYEHAHQKALEALEGARPHIPQSSVIIDDYHAVVLFDEGRHAEALAIWESILPRWQASCRVGDIMPIFALRKAGISAAHTGGWERAAELFLSCSRLAEKSGQSEIAAGALADAGFALWRARLPMDALATFCRSLQAMETMKDPANDTASFRVRVRVNYTINWLLRSMPGEELLPDLVEPAPGVCSSAESSPAFKGMHALPLELSWILLARVESLAGLEPRVFGLVREQLARSAIPVVRLFAAQLEASDAFRRGDFDRLPSLIRAMEVAARDADTQAQQGRQWWETPQQRPSGERQEAGPSADRAGILLDALIAMAAKGRSIAEQLVAWRNDLGTGLSEDSVREWLDLANDAIDWTYHDAVEKMRDSGEKVDRRSMAALRVCREDSPPPNELFYAHVLLFTRPQRGLLNFDTVDSLPELISRQWLEKTRVPALLRNPRSTVPAIESAALTPASGVTRAARVLLAASDAVNVRLPSQLALRLRSLAGVEVASPV